MELDTRLKILKDAGQISESNFEAMIKTIRMFEEKWGIVLTEENGAMFITHLSMAVERITKGGTVEAADENIYREVTENKNYSKCQKVLVDIENETGIKIPPNEGSYLMMYLCSLFDEQCE